MPKRYYENAVTLKDAYFNNEIVDYTGARAL